MNRAHIFDVITKKHINSKGQELSVLDLNKVPYAHNHKIHPLNHGRLIYSAIVSNPNNYVFGINDKFRLNKPLKYGVDRELVDAQTEDCQIRFRTFLFNPNLSNFGLLPKTTQVKWISNKNKKHFVE